MTRHPKTRSRAKLLRSLYIWHRYIGLCAALFVVMLAVTGLALNHTESLNMDSTQVQSDLLLDWYGIHAPDELVSYRAGDWDYTEINEYVFRNAGLIEGIATPLIGAVELGDYTVVAALDRLALLGKNGELIEQLGSAAGVPAGMTAIGTTAQGKLAIKAAHGFYLTDDSFLEWSETDQVNASWSTAETTSAALKQALQQAYRGYGLSLERILLDLHSGRILGNAGVLLVDAAAILFILLAGTGVWLWSRRRASAQAHKRKLNKI